jgi:hypothetical protein
MFSSGTSLRLRNSLFEKPHTWYKGVLGLATGFNTPAFRPPARLRPASPSVNSPQKIHILLTFLRDRRNEKFVLRDGNPQ